MRVVNTAVKKDAITPTASVTAKPRIGPVPKTNRKIAETMVVTWVSMMVRKALLKPTSTAELSGAHKPCLGPPSGGY